MMLEFAGKKPKIHPSAFVAPNAVIIGDVEVGEHSSVWFGAVLRGDMGRIKVGKFCSVQDNCVLHDEKGGETVLGDYVTVGHGAVVHGGKVGDRCMIGANSSVFNGAVIGEGSTVGTGAVVPVGKKVEPRSVVAGVPAKLLRKAKDEEWEGNRKHAENYAELAAKYKRMLG
jgi:carbonic anhydrase/acetyltransferase-like protein (isoleucine patch superfamily)